MIEKLEITLFNPVLRYYLKSHIRFASVTVKTSREQKLYWRLIIVQTDREHSSTLQEPSMMSRAVVELNVVVTISLELCYHRTIICVALVGWWAPGHRDSGRK